MSLGKIVRFRSFFAYAVCLIFALVDIPQGVWRRHSHHLPVVRQANRRYELRIYVMLPAALEQERLFVAERLLSEIERRHSLPRPAQREIPPVIVDRFLTAYLPETRDGEPVPLALEYAFSRSLSEALDLMREVVSESPSGCGAALYVHDLDTGISGGT